MDFVYKTKINIDDYKYLLKEVGWKIQSDRQLKLALDSTMFLSACFYKDKIVGVARLVGDYGSRGLLCNVLVLEEYRRKGIGKAMVESIKEMVYESLLENEEFMICLLPTNGKRDFYIKCGFKYRPEKMDGMYTWIKREE